MMDMYFEGLAIKAEESEKVYTIEYIDHDGNYKTEREHTDCFYTIDDVIESYRESGLEVVSFSRW